MSAAPPAAKVLTFTWPDDWDEHLLATIREQRGKWTPLRVQQLYVDRYQRGLYRADARRFLSQLAHQGVLRLHDRPTGRVYTLNTRKDGS